MNAEESITCPNDIKFGYCGNCRRYHNDYWGEHPEHLVSDWKREVAEDDTRLGYWAWVQRRRLLEKTD